MTAFYKTGRLLLASTLVLTVVGAQAAKGYSVWPSDEQKVKPGMTMDEVKQVLGQPSTNVKFRNESGPTWTYSVINGTDEQRAIFEVDFSADGKVASMDQRVLPVSNSGSSESSMAPAQVHTP